MESNLIDRYVYEVIRRIPEKEREDVSRELKSNIYDMLSDNPDEKEIESILVSLGSPAALADKYRQNPGYLISPRVYYEYVRVLKWLVPLIGVIVMLVGIGIGIAESLSENAEMKDVFKEIFQNAISFGISGAIQAAIWTTIGFVIADRSGYNAEAQDNEWSIDQLPEETPNAKYRINLSDSIVELTMTLIFSILFILFCLGSFPNWFIIKTGETEVRNLFNEAFINMAVPATIVSALFGTLDCSIKIWKRQWTPLVCIVSVVNSLVSMSISLVLILRTWVFSDEFMAFVNNELVENLDFSLWGNNFIISALVIVCIVIVISTLIGCGNNVYKTIKAREAKAGGA